MDKSENKFKWDCIGHNPTKWGLRKEGKTIASVTREDTGHWSWIVYHNNKMDFPRTGTEPSRLLAMGAVETDINKWSEK